MLINKSNFIGLLNLEIGTDTDYLDAIIEQKENELLSDWFSYENVKDIQGVNPTPKNKFLIDGGEYTDSDGKTQYLIGLKNILLNFCYFYIKRDRGAADTSIGTVEALAENANQTYPNRNLADAYNRGVKQTNRLFHYINSNTVDYPTKDYNDHNYLMPINQFGF